MNECPFCHKEKGFSSNCDYCKAYRKMKAKLKEEEKE